MNRGEAQPAGYVSLYFYGTGIVRRDGRTKRKFPTVLMTARGPDPASLPFATPILAYRFDSMTKYNFNGHIGENKINSVAYKTERPLYGGMTTE